MKVRESLGLFLKKEFRKWVITSQTFTKSQEGTENKLEGDFLVYLSVPEQDQPVDTVIFTSRSWSLPLRNVDEHFGGFPPYLGPSIHASILDVLFLLHLLRTFSITHNSPPASQHCLRDGPAAGMLMYHQPGDTCPKGHWYRTCQKI